MSHSPTAAISSLEAKFRVLQKVEFRGETTLTVETDRILEICQFCRDVLGFSYLLDICGVDHLGAEPRFEVVYELYHLERGEWLRLKIQLPDEQLQVASVCEVWPTANWHERETYDMYGIRFLGHPDLRRILMWEGYPYFPLRKDFPVAGKPSEMPDVAFSEAAPLEGGPFVTAPSTATSKDREPRSRSMI